MATQSEGRAEKAKLGARSDNQPPRERHNRQAEILEAATHVFWRRGYASASIQEVADEVGILKGSLYYYIKSKEDLLFRIFEVANEGGMEIVENVRAIDAPPLQKLQLYLQRYVEYYLLNIERVSLYFREPSALTDEHYQIVLEQRRIFDEFVIGLIREARERGDIDSNHQEKYCAYFILGAINALPSWYRREGKDSSDTIARVYAEQSIAMLTGNIDRSY